MPQIDDARTVPLGNLCPMCRQIPDGVDGRCTQHGLFGVPPGELSHLRQAPFLGQLIERRYILVGLVGAGGMGAVYRARQLGIERDVAFKLMHAGGGASEAARARFQREARVVASLESDHTVKVFEFGEIAAGPLAGALFMVMDLVEGISLDKRLRQGPLPLDEIALLLAHVADSVDEAHGKAVIHRDLKPSNILLTAYQGRPRAKVIDFGIARVEDSDQTVNGTALGTPSYMAPELWPSDEPLPVSGRVDVYAMGVVLYQMLTGFKPFRSRDLLVLAVCHRDRPVPSFAGDDPILGALEPVVMRAMEKHPDGRYPTLTSMARDFDSRLATVMHQYGQTESLSVPFMTPSGRAEFTTRDSRSGSTTGTPFRGAVRAQTPPAVEPTRSRRWGVAIGLALTVAAGGLALHASRGDPAAPSMPGPSALSGEASVRAAPDRSGSGALDMTVGESTPPSARDAAAPAADAAGDAWFVAFDAQPHDPPRVEPSVPLAPGPTKEKEPPRPRPPVAEAVDRRPDPPRPEVEPPPPRPAPARPPTAPPDPVDPIAAEMQARRGRLDRELDKALDGCDCRRARQLHEQLARRDTARASAVLAEVSDCIYRLDGETGTCSPR